jgi:septal ring factor EnvC (AmiA/AmiB activator)|nr:MAG TPA: hypothetical protein [Caudoviricetes sp.]
MTVEVAILVSAVSLGFAIYSGVTNMKRNKATDDKKEATEMTTVIVKLEGISRDTSEIKNDLKDVKSDVKKHDEQIIRMDESLKSAWKAINKLQDKGGGDNSEP